jgi:hypothetical protein
MRLSHAELMALREPPRDKNSLADKESVEQFLARGGQIEQVSHAASGAYIPLDCACGCKGHKLRHFGKVNWTIKNNE